MPQTHKKHPTTKQINRWKNQQLKEKHTLKKQAKLEIIQQKEYDVMKNIPIYISSDIAYYFCCRYMQNIKCLTVIFQGRYFGGPIFKAIMGFLTLDIPHAKGGRKKGHIRYESKILKKYKRQLFN